MRALAALSFAGLLLGCAAAHAEALKRRVEIRSVPDGAEVCEVLSGNWKCLGRTPANLELEFRSSNSTKRFHLRRLGFKTGSVLVDADSTSIGVRLDRRQILLPPERLESPRMQTRQAALNKGMEALVFGPNPPALGGFEFIGELALSEDQAGKTTLTVPIIVEDSVRIRRLAPIFREGSRQQAARLADALMEEIVSKLAVELRAAIPATALPDAITVAASYSRAKFHLIEDDTTFQRTTRTWVGSHVQSYGDVSYRVDEFKVSSFRLPTGYTKLAAEEKVFTVVFAMPSAAIPRSLIGSSAAQLRRQSMIMSNDNRAGVFEPVATE